MKLYIVSHASVSCGELAVHEPVAFESREDASKLLAELAKEAKEGDGSSGVYKVDIDPMLSYLTIEYRNSSIIDSYALDYVEIR